MSPRRPSAWTWRTWAFAALGALVGILVSTFVVTPLLHVMGLR